MHELRITAAAARQVVLQLLADKEAAGSVPCVLVGEIKDYGDWWVQAYQSRALIVDGDEDAALAGNGPIVVPKDGSEPFALSSAEPADEQMKRLSASSSGQ